MEEQNADRRGRDEDDDRPRLSEGERGERKSDGRSNRRERRIAREREDRQPHEHRGEPDDRGEPEERAGARGDHLPAAPEAHEDRPPVAEHRGASDQRSDEGALELNGHERGNEALGDVEHDHRRAEPRPETAPDVRGADVPAPVFPDVVAPDQQDEPVPEGEAAGDVAGEDEEEIVYLESIWYFETQSLTVAQSMLSKNASM
jgi:hypothetical protein